jgi:predicted Zn-dependent protease
VIRVVTTDPHDEKQLDKLCQKLYAAFGVGCEHSHAPVPESREPCDGTKLLDEAPFVRAYADDKILYLTSRKLKDRTLPSGVVPTSGLACYGKDRALVTTAGIKNLEEELGKIARQSLHQLGHLWELHHCLDPRCAMYPPWTPSFPEGDPIFCTFCREKSEQKIRLAKS